MFLYETHLKQMTKYHILSTFIQNGPKTCLEIWMQLVLESSFRNSLPNDKRRWTFSLWMYLATVILTVFSAFCPKCFGKVFSWGLWKLFLHLFWVFNHLIHYQTTNFRLFQIEKLCRRQFKIWRKWQKVIPTSRKHCGKRRNCSLRAISPFSTVFSKGLFPSGIKRCHCVGMG